MKKSFLESSKSAKEFLLNEKKLKETEFFTDSELKDGYTRIGIDELSNTLHRTTRASVQYSSRMFTSIYNPNSNNTIFKGSSLGGIVFTAGSQTYQINKNSIIGAYKKVGVDFASQNTLVIELRNKTFFVIHISK